MMRRIAYILLSLLVILIAGVYWLVATQSGLDFVLEKTQKHMPELAVDSAEGQLAGRLKLQNIHYRPESGMQVSVESLDLDWLPWALISGQLLMDQLHISGLELKQGQDAKPVSDESAALPEIAIPISVSIRSLRVINATLQSADGNTTPLFDRLDTRLRMSQDRLVISNLNLNRPELAFMLSGETRLSTPYPVNMNYGLTLYLPDIKPLSVTGTVDGDKRRLNVHQQIGEPLASQQDITLSNVLDNLSWRLESNSQIWELAELNIADDSQLLGMRASGGGDLTRANINISGVIEHQDYPPVSLLSRFETADFINWQLDSDFHLSETAFASIDGTLSEVTSQPQADLKLRWHNLTWPLRASGESAFLSSGVMQIAGGMERFTAGLDANLEAYQQNIDISGRFAGNPRTLEIDMLELQHQDGNINLSGQLALGDAFKYALNAEWRNLHVPPQFTEVPIMASRGNLQLDGEDDKFRIRSRSDLRLNDIPMQLDLQSSSEQTGVASIALNATSGSAKLKLESDVDWRHDPRATAMMQFEQIDPSLLAPEWPGKLAGNLDIDVSAPTGKPPAISVRNMHVFGEFLGKPVDLKTALDYQQQLTLDTFELRSGESTLSAQGTVGEDTMVSFEVDAPSLADFYPKLAGRLSGQGEVAGKTTAPKLKLDLSGDSIQYADSFQLATVTAQGQVSLQNGEDSDLQLSAQDLQLADTTLEQLRLNIDGKPQQHTIRLQAQNADLDFTTRLTGGWNGSQWQGQLNELDLMAAMVGDWQLAEPAALTLAADAQQLNAFCWRSTNNEQLCLDLVRDAKQRWQVEARLSDLDVSRLNPLTEAHAAFNGKLNAEIALQKDNGAPVGRADVVIDGLSARAISDEPEQTSLSFQEFSLKSEFSRDASQLALTVTPDLEGVEPLLLTAQSADLASLLAAPRQTEINAQIQSRIENLSALAFIAPSFEDLQGKLALDADVSGTFNQPTAEARLSLREGQVAISQLGIVLKSLEADIDGDLNEGIGFVYRAESGDGTLDGEGEFSMVEESWQMQTTVRGEQLEVMHLPEAYVVASPDLQLSLSPTNASLSGDLVIPEAELAPLEFNSSVSPSRDVEIVGAEKAPTETLATDVDIRVKLGDDVRITGLGFKGRLTGDLAVAGDAGELLTGNGVITLTDGIYEAYGQKLTVDNGKIRFSGAAIDNPQLDIRAVRTGRDFTAGLHIQGPAASPQATLFSEPTMSQDEILAHILLGRSINSASGDDAAMLASAAASLGIRNGNMLGQEIASTFGLDEFTIRGDGADNAALQIGKHLSPKLYLGYGIGVFEPVSTVQLRYKLNKIWSLQAESGTESGVDLLYIFER